MKTGIFMVYFAREFKKNGKWTLENGGYSASQCRCLILRELQLNESGRNGRRSCQKLGAKYCMQPWI